MKKFITFIVLNLLTFFTYGANYLLLTDLHFNPFSECSTKVFPCPSLSRLINDPVQDWPKNFDKQPIPDIKQEVNNSFLTQGLYSLSKTISHQKISGIFITGDLLSHNFDQKYFTFSPSATSNHTGLTAFSLKAMEYVLSQIHTNFPQANIYFSLGNNDSDRGDYVLPSSSFLQGLEKNLEPFSPGIDNITQTFSQGGFYSAAVNSKLTVISLNMNLLSQINPNPYEAEHQLQWLEYILKEAESQNHKVILIQHIPFGMDLYKTAEDGGAPVPLLESDLQAKYLSTLQHFSDAIVGIYAGHFHMDYFGLINNNIPLIGTLGFSPIFGNSSGFKLLTLDDEGRFLDYTTYVADLNPKGITWQKLYNYSKNYGNSVGLPGTIQHFPEQLSAQKVIRYRAYFNGNQSTFHQPISNDKDWKYYYCGILHMDSVSYNQCISSWVTNS